jgi:hypothetical protein
MAAVRVGEIWELRNANKLGLVVFVRAAGQDQPEDLRLIPVYTHKDALKVATHRDLVIPPELNSLGCSLVVASWNARGLTSACLSRRVGRVRDDVVDGVRAAEMASIIPDYELGVARVWQGPQVSDVTLLDKAVEFQESELAAWDSLTDNLDCIAGREILVFEQDDYSLVLRRSFEALSEAAIAHGVWITHSIEGAYPAFYGGGPSPAYLVAYQPASRTAPTGAVLVSSTNFRELPLTETACDVRTN